MSQGGYVTLVGFVAQDPRQHETGEGRVTDLRVGATTRVQDRVTKEWRDADTSYYNVSCWRRLGDHVRASLRKGDPVVIKGRFKARSWEDKAGQVRTAIDISADTVGHDLNRGIANYMRQQPQPVSTEGGPESGWNDETRPTRDADADTGSGEMIDEEAIERFGRDLDADLDQAERAVRALNEDEEASTSAPF
jgi:single-strand DNA-binding protein